MPMWKLYSSNGQGGWDYTWVNAVNDNGTWWYVGPEGWAEWPPDQDGENPPSEGGGGGGGGGEGGEGGEIDILTLAGPYAGEAADGQDQPNPNWPPLPPKMRPPVATGWPPHDADIWEEPDGSWRVISADGNHIGVYDSEGRLIRSVHRAAFPSGTYTITFDVATGENFVTAPEGTTFEMPRTSINEDEAGRANRIYLETYYNSRNNGLTREEARNAARAALLLAGLAGFVLTVQISGAVLGVIALIEATADNITSCDNTLPNLVGFCYSVKQFCAGLVNCIGSLSGFCNQALVQISLQPNSFQKTQAFQSFTAKQNEINSYLYGTATGWLSEAHADWLKWQGFDCSSGGGIVVANYNNSTLPNKWNPRMTGGEGQSSPDSLLLKYAKLRGDLEVLRDNTYDVYTSSYGLLPEEWNALPFPKNPGEYL